MSEETNGRVAWWRDFFTPQTLISLIGGLLIGARMVYSNGMTDANVANDVASMKGQLASMSTQIESVRQTMVTREMVSSLPTTYASKVEVSVLDAKFASHRDYITDKLASMGAQLNNVEKLAGEAAGHSRR